MTEPEIINKTAVVLNRVFARVTLVSPYYEMLRELQQDVEKYLNKEKEVARLRNEGKTIREIAKEMGYKHPGSITHLLNKNQQP